MAKGYWIGRVDVKNVEGMKQYASGNPPIFKKFGGRYLVRSDKCEVPEGNSRARHVVVDPIMLPPLRAITRLNTKRTYKCGNPTQSSTL